MAVQGEDLASKIEERIKQAMDAIVGDIRVSLDDVREVVNQHFDAALQSVLADAKSLTLRDDLEELLSEISVTAEAPEPAPAPPRTGLAHLKKAVQSIERGTSQVDVLNALLDQLLVFGSRAALLILKGDSFSGWKGKGFAAFGGNDESIKRLSMPPGEVAELDRVRLDETVVRWNGASFAQRASMALPSDAVAVPMVIKDKISAVVYVDSMEDSETPLDQSAVELLVFTTGLLVDTLAIRKKIPSPTLSREADGEPFETELEPTLKEPPPPPRPQPAPTPPAPPAEAERPVSTATLGTMRVRTPAPPAPAPEPERPSPQVRPPEEPPQQVRPPEPPRSTPPEPAASTQVRPPSPPGEGSTQYVPPPGLKGGFAARAEVGEDAKKHDDARRFARLLVSEIKLYNEGKVDQGRKNGDLYERLKEDIDRSRQMYDDRVPPEVREVSNYFYDELVRILADGNPEALGL